METTPITIEGVLTIRLVNNESKSMGKVAQLDSFTLYRPDQMEIDDPYFVPFDGKVVRVNGEDEHNGMLCVDSLELAVPSNTSALSKHHIHLPRRLKKKLKKLAGQRIK